MDRGIKATPKRRQGFLQMLGKKNCDMGKHMQTFLFLDRVTLFNFSAILYLQFRFGKLKIICGTLPSNQFFFRQLERYLLRRFKIAFVSYQHLDLHGVNIPEELENNFGELKDNINERSFICCEKLFSRKIVKQRSYKNILRFLNGDCRVESFVKKNLLSEYYCREQISLFEFANMISSAKGGIEFFFLLANDPYDLFSIYKESGFFKFKPILLFKRAHFFLSRIIGIFVGPLVPALIISRAIRRLSFSPSRKDLKGRRIWIHPINYGFLSNLFKETSHLNSNFSVKEALFIWEGPDAAGQTERYRLEHNMRSIRPEKAPIHINYFCSRILKDMCCSFIARQIFLSVFFPETVFMWKVTLSMLNTIIDYESLCRISDVKLFLLSRYYLASNAIKTIIINKYGGQTASLQFGEINHPMSNIFVHAYCCLNHFFCYGEGMGELEKYAYQVGQFHIIGPNRADLSIQLKQKAESLREKFGLNNSFVITVFGPAYNETAARRRYVLAFYRAVYFAFLGVENRNVTLIIKAHKKDDMAEEELDFPELANLMKPFRGHAKVRYYYYENPYELMALTDLAISWSNSTTGIESIATGNKTIYFDPMQSRFHPYKIYHEKLVVNSEDQVKELVGLAVDGRFPIGEDIYAKIIDRHCYSNDGNSSQRLLDSLHKIANGVKK